MATTRTKKVRINFYVTEKVEKIIAHYTEELGITQSAFVSMAIVEYAKSDDVMQNMKNIETMLNKIQALQK